MGSEKMRNTLHRQAHIFLLIAVVCIATLPSWFVEASDAGFEENLKASTGTDTDTIRREEEAMSNDGYSIAEKRLLQEGDKYQFQAEVSRLMSLIINSLYSNKEIFLRELISNASDALDKIRFMSLTDPSVLASNQALEIRIKPDPENNKLHIIDTGVGMTREELVTNLGTIAKSGTNEFIKKASESGDTSSLIGQFGVGFYSAFLVADRVTVTSKSNDGVQCIWSSDSNGEFVVDEDPEGDTLGRGTVITLHLKDDSLSFLNQDILRGLVSKYSEFINFPIYLWASHVEERQITVEAEDDAEEDSFDDEEEEEEEDWDNIEIVEETIWEWELLNTVKPLWTRDPSDITDEEYISFYKSLAKSDDTEDPYTWSHFAAEGDNLQFKAILYLPQEVPDDMFNTARSHNHRGVKLYVRRVFISDEFDGIIPKYLSFIRGVVDSDSLPLNVSREILQQDKALRQMEKKIVRKAIAMIQKLAQEDEDAYNDFYSDYRLNLKLGVLEDKPNQERLAKLLRFHTSKSGSGMVSLDQYIENMKEGQKKIYYLGGENRDAVANSPLLERLVSRDYEVLYLTDSIDEYWTQTFTTYDGTQLVNIAKDVNLELEEEEEEEEVDAEEFKDLLAFFKAQLGSKISKAVLSKRLTTTPSALISSAYSYSANMERIQKAQALGQGVDPFMSSKKILELNPKHDLVIELNNRVTVNPNDQTAIDLGRILYDTAALHSGFSLDNPSAFARSIHRMMELGLRVADPAEAPEPEPEHDEL